MSHRISAAELAQQLSGAIIKPLPNNFVERPWGGTRIREFKRLCSLPDQPEIGGAGLGETFEVAAFNEDNEARQFPSLIAAGDGARISLPDLLAESGAQLLGSDWIARHGSCVPLLPKFLNIRELLSVQGHPAGHTEVYVVIDAEPGASIRLGFRRDMDRTVLRRELLAGIAAQHRLAEMLGDAADWQRVQYQISRFLAARTTSVDAALKAAFDAAEIHIDAVVQPATSRGASQADIESVLATLHRQYWFMLDAMNEIKMQPGQIIFNANPPSVAAKLGRAPAAEVHALGNPEGREIVMLEIRRPGPTLRAWDNVRFPMREIDIDGALDVLNLSATSSDDFIVNPQAIGSSAHCVSVDSENFRVEHVYVDTGGRVDLPAGDTHCLHVVAGGVRIQRDNKVDTLEQGESGLVTHDFGAYSVIGTRDASHIVKVSIP